VLNTFVVFIIIIIIALIQQIYVMTVILVIWQYCYYYLDVKWLKFFFTYCLCIIEHTDVQDLLKILKVMLT